MNARADASSLGSTCTCAPGSDSASSASRVSLFEHAGVAAILAQASEPISGEVDSAPQVLLAGPCEAGLHLLPGAVEPLVPLDLDPPTGLVEQTLPNLLRLPARGFLSLLDALPGLDADLMDAKLGVRLHRMDQFFVRHPDLLRSGGA